MWTQISGRMPASSQASNELSTASLTVVSRALRGLSKPNRCRFLAKNSLTEMSRCLAAIDWAVARRRGGAVASPFISAWAASVAGSSAASSASSALALSPFLLGAAARLVFRAVRRAAFPLASDESLFPAFVVRLTANRLPPESHGESWVRRCIDCVDYTRGKTADPDAFSGIFALKIGAFGLSVTQRFTRTTVPGRHH